ncbi:hypothetical protein PHMEG_00018165 [Phytophthora megakarya]|uniref:Uncharacterized protein n=1 Tax=Phytophthora megakarya TaxID=4795 RepID=A0A225VUQ7_9STRA|nr:hypothetical protein PHMEG_00018165 [Phytophthora megakarya]
MPSNPLAVQSCTSPGFCEGRNWQLAASSNDVNYWTARHSVLPAEIADNPIRPTRVKMTM